MYSENSSATFGTRNFLHQILQHILCCARRVHLLATDCFAMVQAQIAQQCDLPARGCQSILVIICRYLRCSCSWSCTSSAAPVMLFAYDVITAVDVVNAASDLRRRRWPKPPHRRPHACGRNPVDRCRSRRARFAESYAPFSIASSSGSVGEINSVGKVKARLSKLRPHIAAIAATMITFDRSNADLDAHCSGSVTAT